MNATLEPLSAELRQFSSELRLLEKRLQTSPAPDAVALHEFRQAVDNVRLTAWSVSEAERGSGVFSALFKMAS